MIEEGIRSSQRMAFERQNLPQRLIARRLRMKKKKKAGNKATKWQNNVKRSNTWKIQLKEEEWQDALLS